MKNIKQNLIILGAGQYGQVAKEVAKSLNFDHIAFLDDRSEQAIGKLGDYNKFINEYSHAFVAIGNSELRLAYINKLEDAGFELAALVSPQAYISPSAKIMGGTIVESLAVVNANSNVGRGVFVCAHAVVNHNAVVEDCCQLDCGSVVGSNVVLAAKTKLKYNETFDKEREEKELRRQA